MKRLQYYYYYVGIPVLLVLLGTAVFFQAIMSTVRGNPHPQINYIIFLLIGAGCVQMMMHVRRINREGNLLTKFFQVLVQDDNVIGAEKMLKQDKLQGKSDVIDILTLLLGLHGQMIGPGQHAAVDLELERFQASQARRLLLSQFMAGMMVGMGLLGTFIGLLGALAEIGKLIGSFNLGAGMSDPVAAISELVTRLTSPMQAMGVAFSASLFGVLGSLIMGVLMVSVRSAAGDLVSMVQSRVSLVVDATEADEATNDMKILSRALGELAQHSPILQGLAVALDQSERRVREVLGAVSQLTACVDDNTRNGVQVLESIKQGAQTQVLSRLAIEQVQQDFAKLLQLQATTEQQNSQLAQVIVKQQSHIEGLINKHATQNSKLHQHQVTLMQQQETLWRDQGNTLRNQTDQQQQFWEEMLMQNETAMALVRKTAREQTVLDREQWNQQFGLQEAALEQARQQAREQVQADRSVWQQQMQKREQELNLAFKNMTVQADTERQLWLSQSQSWNESITHSHESMQALLERSLTEQIGQWTQLQSKIQQDQTYTVQFLSEFSALVAESTQTLRHDSRARTEFANQFHMHLSESQTRQEQLMHVLTATVAQTTKAP